MDGETSEGVENGRPLKGLFCYAEASPLSKRFQVGGIRGGSMINGWATALSSKGIDGFCGSKGTRTNGARSSYCGRGQAGSRGSEGRMPLLNEEVKLGGLP